MVEWNHRREQFLVPTRQQKQQGMRDKTLCYLYCMPSIRTREEIALILLILSECSAMTLQGKLLKQENYNCSEF